MAEAHHVVWDWNGTILDDSDMVIEISNEVFAAAGFAAVSRERYRAAFRRPIRAFYEELAGSPITDEQWMRLDRLFHDTYASRAGEISLAHGVVEVFAHIKSLGWTQSILSMYPHDGLMDHIGRFDIGRVFARIDGSRHSNNGPSKAGYLIEHLEMIGIGGKNITLIGDSLDDVAAAESVGGKAIFYASGLHSDEAAATLTCPVAHTMAEVLALLPRVEAVTR